MTGRHQPELNRQTLVSFHPLTTPLMGRAKHHRIPMKLSQLRATIPALSATEERQPHQQHKRSRSPARWTRRVPNPRYSHCRQPVAQHMSQGQGRRNGLSSLAFGMTDWLYPFYCPRSSTKTMLKENRGRGTYFGSIVVFRPAFGHVVLTGLRPDRPRKPTSAVSPRGETSGRCS